MSVYFKALSKDYIPSINKKANSTHNNIASNKLSTKLNGNKDKFSTNNQCNNNKNNNDNNDRKILNEKITLLDIKESINYTSYHTKFILISVLLILLQGITFSTNMIINPISLLFFDKNNIDIVLVVIITNSYLGSFLAFLITLKQSISQVKKRLVYIKLSLTATILLTLLEYFIDNIIIFSIIRFILGFVTEIAVFYSLKTLSEILPLNIKSLTMNIINSSYYFGFSVVFIVFCNIYDYESPVFFRSETLFLYNFIIVFIICIVLLGFIEESYVGLIRLKLYNKAFEIIEDNLAKKLYIERDTYRERNINGKDIDYKSYYDNYLNNIFENEDSYSSFKILDNNNNNNKNDYINGKFCKNGNNGNNNEIERAELKENGISYNDININNNSNSNNLECIEDINKAELYDFKSNKDIKDLLSLLAKNDINILKHYRLTRRQKISIINDISLNNFNKSLKSNIVITNILFNKNNIYTSAIDLSFTLSAILVLLVSLLVLSTIICFPLYCLKNNLTIIQITHYSMGYAFASLIGIALGSIILELERFSQKLLSLCFCIMIIIFTLLSNLNIGVIDFTNAIFGLSSNALLCIVITYTKESFTLDDTSMNLIKSSMLLIGVFAMYLFYALFICLITLNIYYVFSCIGVVCFVLCLFLPNEVINYDYIYFKEIISKEKDWKKADNEFNIKEFIENDE